MIFKTFKWTAIVLVVGALAGGAVFGSDLLSYARSSARSVQSAVKDSVPIEFELRRARDLLDQIIPEMHANIRLIAQEEVEIGVLEDEIRQAHERVGDERVRVARLREMLAAEKTRFVIAGRQYDRTQVRNDLARRLERVKEADLMLASKERLLTARQDSLAGARSVLEKTRSQKALLEDRIESMEAQYRLVQAASVGTRMEFDNSKIAQTEKLLGQIKKRLDVAERVLTHQSRFVQTIPIDTVDEGDLLDQVDDYLETSREQVDQAVDAGSPGEAIDREQLLTDSAAR